jgi:hypothetical protein
VLSIDDASRASAQRLVERQRKREQRQAIEQRIREHVRRWVNYVGFEPRRVPVFREDFELLDLSHFDGKPYSVVCGPSRSEYA